MINKDNVKELTIEELTICHNEYNKRMITKEQKQGYNQRHYKKIKKTTEKVSPMDKEEIKKTTELNKLDIFK